MLIEVKARVSRIIDGKDRKKTETFLVQDCDLFSNAEYRVLTSLIREQEEGFVSCSEILSLRQSPIKEVCTQFQGDCTFIATLKDIFHEDDGTEKTLRYKVLLWANSLTEANHNVQLLSREGYDMQIEGIKQVDYEYLESNIFEEEQEDEQTS